MKHIEVKKRKQSLSYSLNNEFLLFASPSYLKVADLEDDRFRNAQHVNSCFNVSYEDVKNIAIGFNLYDIFIEKYNAKI